MNTSPVLQKAPPVLGYGDYVRFGNLLLDRCGLHFSDNRRAELELGIRHAFAASTCANLDEYYQVLCNSEAGAVEMDRLINAVTVNETHFFRDAAQFDALYYQVLPQVIERKRPLRTLRIWSAGCASGEEPYSLAMLLRELLADVDDWSITILGTDINTAALDRARKATYGEWAFREVRAKQWRPRYFRPSGSRYELIPEVRRMVTFAKLNLAEPGYPSYTTNTALMDLILCRNVTIYFNEAVTIEVAERFYNALVDGGWLVVGHSEPSLTTYRRFQVRNFPNAILYQRVVQPDMLWLDWNWAATMQAQVAAKPAAPSMPDVTFLPEPMPAPVIAPPLVVPAIQPSVGQDPFDHAQELIEYGRSEEARDLLLELLQSKPNHSAACALVGQTYANLGCWEEAETWCRRSVSQDKLLLDAYYTLSLVHQHQGKLDEAVDAMKKVIYIDRNYVLGHFGLANLYYEKKQLPQAHKSLDNARRLLEARLPEELIPGSGGVTVARLHEAIVRQQQAWSVN